MARIEMKGNRNVTYPIKLFTLHRTFYIDQLIRLFHTSSGQAGNLLDFILTGFIFITIIFMT